MSDIVERLREHATDWNGEQMPDLEPAKGDPTAGMLRYAADAIESLRAEKVRLTEERDALASILDGAIKDERIDEIDRIANYKYFGEYELSDTQLDATLDAIYALNAIKRMRAILKGE